MMSKKQDEQPQDAHGVCPHCGFCPTCGRSNETQRYIPYPVPQPYPVPTRTAPWQVPPWNTVICGSSKISVEQNPSGYRTFTINSGGSQ